jgi:hypothetical protein
MSMNIGLALVDNFADLKTAWLGEIVFIAYLLSNNINKGSSALGSLMLPPFSLRPSDDRSDWSLDGERLVQPITVAASTQAIQSPGFRRSTETNNTPQYSPSLAVIKQLDC